MVLYQTIIKKNDQVLATRSKGFLVEKHILYLASVTATIVLITFCCIYTVFLYLAYLHFLVIALSGAEGMRDGTVSSSRAVVALG